MRTIVLIFITLSSLSIISATQSVHIQGRLERTLYRPGGIVKTDINQSFEVWVGTGGWLIRDNYTPERNHYMASGYNGDSVFRFLMSDVHEKNSKDLMNPDAPLVSTGPLIPGSITHSDIPLDSGMFTYLDWFIYCSQSFFQKRPSEKIVIAPWSDPRCQITGAAVHAKIYSYLSNGTPSKIDFTLTKEAKSLALKSKVIDDQAKTPEDLAALEQIPENFHIGDYNVVKTEYINQLNIEIPALVEMHKYIYLPGGEDGAYTKYIISLTSFDVVNEPDYLPPIPDGKIIGVLDYRLNNDEAGIKYMNYQIKDHKWPIQPPKDIKAQFDEEVRNIKNAKVVKHNLNAYAKVLFAIIIGAPVIVFIGYILRGKASR